MDAPYHRSITAQALAEHFSPRALQAILAANVGQDTLAGQIAHDEYHFDNNAFAASSAYIEARRAEVRPALAAGNQLSAWQAFGRLTHSVQDFYAHTNYIALWLAKTQGSPSQAAEEIDPLDAGLLTSPELKSGRLYYPFEMLTFVPLIKDWVIPLLPRDSHAWMNMDTPQRPNYAYAEAAAIRRTRHEFDRIIDGWPPELLAAFTEL